MVEQVRVGVVVIVYDDAALLSDAVRSALAQGPAVTEVTIVDDASTDASAAVADRLAAEDSRVRVIRRSVNSGGCGTPRNDGVDASRADWIVFLDSDDVLPPGAVSALVDAGVREGADVVAGRCVRRELPRVRDVPWQPDLFARPGVFDGLAGRPRTVWDTLSVNKAYRRAFLIEHDIRFPDGAAHYEDFVFTARVYAAGPRFVVITDDVYTWHVRRAAGDPSISLRRDRVRNWLDRLDAHRQVLEILDPVPELRLVAETKFVDHDLPLYLRDLHARDEAYRAEWWSSTRAHLAGFDPRALALARPAARWAAAVVRAREEPVDLLRLSRLAADPPRLTGPLRERDGVPVWDDRAPAVELDGLAAIPTAELPVEVRATVHAGRRSVLDVSVRDLYERLRPGRPHRIELELRDRHGEAVRVAGAGTGVLHEESVDPDGGSWSTTIGLDNTLLSTGEPFTVWDVWAVVHLRDGTHLETKVAAGAGLGRRVQPDLRHGLALAQFYATASGSLAIRFAGGVGGVREVLDARIRRRRASP
ncbi:glycosyltransferase family 2 protein [Embleya sp. NPDC059237]|uniref:glycosyltransferase family 2 protein n=1 Tax=Embleya sp. NPDC059237 TaxID=3346784 RepID=UPI0036BFD4ED